jgi:transposase-like protein
VFILVDRGTDDRYVMPGKTVDESTIRLLLAVSQQESLTVYTDGFRSYEPLEEDAAFDREYVVHDDGEYADGDVHVNTIRIRLSCRTAIQLSVHLLQQCES